MKHNLLLVTSIIISSMVLGMEITYTSFSLSKCKSHKQKATISIPNQTNNNNDISIQLDQNGTLSMNKKTKGPRTSSPRNNKIELFERV